MTRSSRNLSESSISSGTSAVPDRPPRLASISSSCPTVKIGGTSPSGVTRPHGAQKIDSRAMPPTVVTATGSRASAAAPAAIGLDGVVSAKEGAYGLSQRWTGHFTMPMLVKEAIHQAGAKGASDSDIIEYMKRHRPGTSRKDVVTLLGKRSYLGVQWWRRDDAIVEGDNDAGEVRRMYWLSPPTDKHTHNTPPTYLPPSNVPLSTTATTNASLPPFSSSASAAPMSSSSSSSSSSQSAVGGRPIHALFRPSSGGIENSGNNNGALSESECGDVTGLAAESSSKPFLQGGMNANATTDASVVVYEGPRRVGTGLDDVCIVCAQTTDERDAARIVLCDYEECAAEVHLFCLGLKEVPGYTWFCSPQCHRRTAWTLARDRRYAAAAAAAHAANSHAKRSNNNRRSRSSRHIGSRKRRRAVVNEDYKGNCDDNMDLLPATVPPACDPWCPDGEWRQAAPMVVTPSGFAIYCLPSNTDDSAFDQAVEDDIVRNGYRSCGTFDTENTSQAPVERPFDGIVYCLVGSLTITLNKPLQQSINEGAESTSPLSTTTDCQASEDVQKARGVMCRIKKAPKITVLASTEATAANEDDVDKCEDHEKDEHEDAQGKNEGPQESYAMNIDNDQLAGSAQGIAVEKFDAASGGVETSGRLSNDEVDPDEDDENDGVLLIDEKRAEGNDESEVTTVAQAAAINALSMLANTATVFKGQHRESDSSAINAQSNEMEESGESRSELGIFSSDVGANSRVKGNNSSEDDDATDTDQHENQEEVGQFDKSETIAELASRMTTRRRNSELDYQRQHYPPNAVRVVLKGHLVPRPSIDADEADSDADQQESSGDEHHERRTRREVRAPSTYPRGSVFLDGSTSTSHGVSPHVDSQGDASSTTPAVSAGAPATNASFADSLLSSHPSSLSSPGKFQQPPADALRLRAVRAAAASAPSSVVRPAASSTPAGASMQSTSQTHGSSAPNSVNAFKNASMKVTSKEATIMERGQHSKYYGMAANAPLGKQIAGDVSSKARAEALVAEPPVVVDDSESVSLSLRPGEKAVIPTRLRYSVSFGAGCIHVFAVGPSNSVVVPENMPAPNDSADSTQSLWPLFDAWDRAERSSRQRDEWRKMHVEKAREASDLRAQLAQRDQAITALRGRLDAQQRRLAARAHELAELSEGIANDLAAL